MKEEKTGSMVGTIVKTVIVISAVHAGLIVLARHMSNKARELEKHNAGQKNKKYMTFMNGRELRISKEEVNDISIRTMMGGVNLDLTEAYITQDMEIRIQSVMSGVAIKVPPMVRVVLDGTNIMGGFANMVPTYEREDIPTIRIEAESIMGGISVEMVPEP